MLRSWILGGGIVVLGFGCWDSPPGGMPPAPPMPRAGLPDYAAEVCQPICDAVNGEDTVPLLPRGAPVRPGPLGALVVVADGRLGAVDTEQLRIHLHGWGLPAEVVEARTLGVIDLDRYSTVLVLPSEMGAELGPANEAALANAVAAGTSLVWIGIGVPASLGGVFGVDVLDTAYAAERGVTGLAPIAGGSAPDAPVFDELYTRLELRGATAAATFRGGAGDGDAAVTYYRPDATSGMAVLLAFNVLGFWDEHPDGHAWTRAELLQQAIVDAHPNGAAMIDPFPGLHRGALLIRVEDLSPGGSRSSHNFADWIDRFEWVENELGHLGVRMNLSIVARFKDPARGEEFAWDAPHPLRERLHATLRDALGRGATLISHGLTHQMGTGDMDYTGIDWEMSDDDTGEFLPYDEQLARIVAARDELTAQFGVVPTVWETPHLEGNLDTYRAAREAGYAVMSEADGNLFPNRSGVEGAIGGALLNVPHTGSFVPTEDGEATAFLETTTRWTLPRLVRLRAPFYVFYHGFRDEQADTLLILADCCTECGLWRPTVPEFAAWWEAREGATVRAEVEADRIRASVQSMPENGSLTVRLPDAREPGDVQVSGRPVARMPILRGATWYVQVPVPAGDSTVEVRFAP